jgi:DNA-binding response OmpR family regulator
VTALQHRSNAQQVERRPLVLIVDSNEDHREMYMTFLWCSGFGVIGAPDGSIGFAQAQAMGPDVILMELYMPDLNGWETCRWLRTSVETARIPIIALSAVEFDEAKPEATEGGFGRFIFETTELDHVAETISAVLADAAV